VAKESQLSWLMLNSDADSCSYERLLDLGSYTSALSYAYGDIVDNACAPCREHPPAPAREEFVAWAVCPECGDRDYHHLTERLDVPAPGLLTEAAVMRECRACDHRWMQMLGWSEGADRG
jgi:Zn ribbon nucleic-acid-binding protein